MPEKGKLPSHLEIIRGLHEPQPLSLGSEMERQARERPDQSALIYEDQVITYGQLNSMANCYANLFSRRGFKKGDVVALLMENRPEYLMIVTGLSKLGVIVSLINTGVREEVLAHGINVCEARAIIVGHELLELYNTVAIRIRLKTPAAIFVETEGKELALPEGMEDINVLLRDVSVSNPVTTTQISNEDTLVYLYTAGTTGWRKATAVTHKRWLLVGHLLGLYGYMSADSVQYMCLPFFYNSGFNFCFSGMVVWGGRMVIKRDFSASRFWDDVRKYQTNYCISVGEMARYIYNQPPKPDDQNNPLEVLICGGIWRNLIEPFRQRFGVRHIIEVYGNTEGVGNFINNEEISGMCGHLTLGGPGGIRQGEVVRCDLAGQEMIRDENGRGIKCAPGETGLLICELNALNVFTGYIGDSEASESKVLRDVLRDGDQYFNTGDAVQLHKDDYISFVDRLGDTYRWKGRTVSASQVADVINKFFGGIEDTIVYGVKVPGMEGRCGMAAVQMLEGETLDWKALITHINNRMPPHARPVFVRVCQHIDDGDDLRSFKRQFQEEGFNPGMVVKDRLYFLDPQRDCYVPLSKEIYADIMAQKMRL